LSEKECKWGKRIGQYLEVPKPEMAPLSVCNEKLFYFGDTGRLLTHVNSAKHEGSVSKRREHFVPKVGAGTEGERLPSQLLYFGLHIELRTGCLKLEGEGG